MMRGTTKAAKNVRTLGQKCPVVRTGMSAKPRFMQTGVDHVGERPLVTEKEPTATIVALPRSAALIAHAAAAIHALSISEQKMVSMRGAAVAGFDAIIDDKRLTVSILLRIHEQYDFSGREKIHVGFSIEEMKMLHECRKRLEAMKQTKLDRVQTITLALMRLARPEFGQNDACDVRTLPTIDSGLPE